MTRKTQWGRSTKLRAEFGKIRMDKMMTSSMNLKKENTSKKRNNMHWKKLKYISLTLT